MNFKPSATFFRFLIAGGVNTLFGWLIYSVAILLGAKPWLALIIGLVAGVAFNFATLGYYVFRDLALSRFTRFSFSYACIYLINLACLQWVTLWIEDPIWGQLFLSLPMSALSFMLMSHFVFKRKQGDQEAMQVAQINTSADGF